MEYEWNEWNMNGMSIKWMAYEWNEWNVNDMWMECERNATAIWVGYGWGWWNGLNWVELIGIINIP